MKSTLTFISLAFSFLVFGVNLSLAQVGLNVVSGTSVSNVNGAAGYLAVGPTSNNYIAIDGDDIQRRAGQQFGTLYLNYYGGNVSLGYGSEQEATSVTIANRASNNGMLSAYSIFHVRGDTDRVGIGTSNPADELHVIGADNDGTNATLRVQSGSQFMLFDGNEVDANGNIYFNHNTEHDLYVGTGGGQLGVGTTNVPAGYRIAVDGNMIAERVRVRLSQNWPDYVFQSDYQLMPLTELQQNIADNGHLPNIPAAAIMEKDGQDLGEMQVKMMEKIEELTLYILELHERIETLESDQK
ncbi:MAG: hypothetical protein AB8G22_20675 [Saprospiraceae bacterium]